MSVTNLENIIKHKIPVDFESAARGKKVDNNSSLESGAVTDSLNVQVNKPVIEENAFVEYTSSKFSGSHFVDDNVPVFGAEEASAIVKDISFKLNQVEVGKQEDPQELDTIGRGTVFQPILNKGEETDVSFENTKQVFKEINEAFLKGAKVRGLIQDGYDYNNKINLNSSDIAREIFIETLNGFNKILTDTQKPGLPAEINSLASRGQSVITQVIAAIKDLKAKNSGLSEQKVNSLKQICESLSTDIANQEANLPKAGLGSSNPGDNHGDIQLTNIAMIMWLLQILIAELIQIIGKLNQDFNQMSSNVFDINIITASTTLNTAMLAYDNKLASARQQLISTASTGISEFSLGMLGVVNSLKFGRTSASEEYNELKSNSNEVSGKISGLEQKIKAFEEANPNLQNSMPLHLPNPASPQQDMTLSQPQAGQQQPSITVTQNNSQNQPAVDNPTHAQSQTQAEQAGKKFYDDNTQGGLSEEAKYKIAAGASSVDTREGLKDSVRVFKNTVNRFTNSFNKFKETYLSKEPGKYNLEEILAKKGDATPEDYKVVLAAKAYVKAFKEDFDKVNSHINHLKAYSNFEAKKDNHLFNIFQNAISAAQALSKTTGSHFNYQAELLNAKATLYDNVAAVIRTIVEVNRSVNDLYVDSLMKALRDIMDEVKQLIDNINMMRNKQFKDARSQ